MLQQDMAHHGLDFTNCRCFADTNQKKGPKYVLKVEERVVTVRNDDGELKMCATDPLESMQKDYEAHICERTTDENRQMTVHFIKQQSYYWIKVVNNKLTVEKTSGKKPLDKLDKNYWFVMRNNGVGNEYSLNPVGAPRVWLSLLSDQPYSFTLSAHSQESVQVSAEPI